MSNVTFFFNDWRFVIDWAFIFRSRLIYQPGPLGCWICWRWAKPNGTSHSVCGHLPLREPVRARWWPGTYHPTAHSVLVIQPAAPSLRLRVVAASGAGSSWRGMEPDPLYGFGWQRVSSWNSCFEMMMQWWWHDYFYFDDDESYKL